MLLTYDAKIHVLPNQTLNVEAELQNRFSGIPAGLPKEEAKHRASAIEATRKFLQQQARGFVIDAHYRLEFGKWGSFAEGPEPRFLPGPDVPVQELYQDGATIRVLARDGRNVYVTAGRQRTLLSYGVDQLVFEGTLPHGALELRAPTGWARYQYLSQDQATCVIDVRRDAGSGNILEATDSYRSEKGLKLQERLRVIDYKSGAPYHVQIDIYSMDKPIESALMTLTSVGAGRERTASELIHANEEVSDLRLDLGTHSAQTYKFEGRLPTLAELQLIREHQAQGEPYSYASPPNRSGWIVGLVLLVVVAGAGASFAFRKFKRDFGR